MPCVPMFTSTGSTCFCQNTTYQTRVVHSEVALWLTRMSELSLVCLRRKPRDTTREI